LRHIARDHLDRLTLGQALDEQIGKLAGDGGFVLRAGIDTQDAGN
jgi:hypothetical protein